MDRKSEILNCHIIFYARGLRGKSGKQIMFPMPVLRREGGGGRISRIWTYVRGCLIVGEENSSSN